MLMDIMAGNHHRIFSIHGKGKFSVIANVMSDLANGICRCIHVKRPKLLSGIDS